MLQHQSPFHCLSAHFPDLFLHTPLPLRVFGCVSFVHIPKHSWDKLDPRALRCVFLGYSTTQKGYKCYHLPTRKFYVSIDVTFVESTPFFGSSPVGHQGEILVGDQSHDNDFFFFPNLRAASPIYSNTDQPLVQPGSIPSPIPSPQSPTYPSRNSHDQGDYHCW